jgi:hypothetical protein
MSNTWTGTSYINISQRILAALNARLAQFAGIFATNFSDQVPQGNTVRVNIVPAAADAVDLGGVSENREHANVIKDVTNTYVDVVLDKKPATGFTLSLHEMAQIGSGVWTPYAERLIASKVNSIARSVADAIIGEITAAAFSNAKTVNAAAFDSDDVSALRTLVDGLDWDEQERSFLVLGTSLHESLRQDPSIKNKAAAQSDTLNTGDLPMLSGFMPVKNVRIPKGTTPIAEKLRGFVCRPDAIAIAFAPGSAQQSGAASVEFEDTLTDPQTGLTIQYSVWYTPATKAYYHCVECWWGVVAAMGTSLVRIREA